MVSELKTRKTRFCRRRKDIPRKRIRLNYTYIHTHTRARIQQKENLLFGVDPEVLRVRPEYHGAVAEMAAVAVASITVVRLSEKYPTYPSDAGGGAPGCTPCSRNTSYFFQTNIGRCQVLIGSPYIYPGPGRFIPLTARLRCDIRALVFSAVQYSSQYSCQSPPSSLS